METTGITIGGAPVSVGDRVVYPNGGICRVKGVESKQIAGQAWVMLMLSREEDGATVMVPQTKVNTIGLRKVATADSIDVLFQFFTHSSADPELDWKVRHRENFEKMAAGGLLDTAQVLKGLHALAQIRPLPQKEREMYDSARHQLIGEISAALNVPAAVAENNIDYALTPPPGSGRTAPKDAPLDLKALRRSMGGGRRAAGLGEELEEEESETLGLEDEAEETEEAGAEEGKAAEGEEAEGSEEKEGGAPAVAAKPKKAAGKALNGVVDGVPAKAPKAKKEKKASFPPAPALTASAAEAAAPARPEPAAAPPRVELPKAPPAPAAIAAPAPVVVPPKPTEKLVAAATLARSPVAEAPVAPRPVVAVTPTPPAPATPTAPLSAPAQPVAAKPAPAAPAGHAEPARPVETKPVDKPVEVKAAAKTAPVAVKAAAHPEKPAAKAKASAKAAPHVAKPAKATKTKATVKKAAPKVSSKTSSKGKGGRK